VGIYHIPLVRLELTSYLKVFPIKLQRVGDLKYITLFKDKSNYNPITTTVNFQLCISYNGYMYDFYLIKIKEILKIVISNKIKTECLLI
jgi:hypothetical protein